MDQKQHKRTLTQRFLFYLILGLMFILTSVIYEWRVVHRNYPERIAENFQEDFLEMENDLSACLDSLSQPKLLDNIFASDTFIRKSLSIPDAFYFFKYVNDSLVYWSDNDILLSPEDIEAARERRIIELVNGIYYYSDTMVGDNRIAGLFIIKHYYPYQNLYLQNRFHSPFEAPPSTGIAFQPGTYNISDSRGFLFSIDPPLFTQPGKIPGMFLLWFYAIAFLSICAALFQLYLRLAGFIRSKLLLVLSFSIDVILLRVLMFIFEVPRNLHASYLFSPDSFAASDWIPSLGDFLFNSLTLLVIAFTLFVTYRNIIMKRNIASFRRYFLIFSLFLHVFIFFRLFIWASNSLVMDATYSMNLNQVFFLSAESFLSLGVMTILLFSFFLVSYRILGLAYHYAKRKPGLYFLFFGITTAVYALVCIFIHDCNLLLFIPLVVYGIVFFFQASVMPDLQRVSFSAVVLYLFLFAILSTAMLSAFNARKEIEQRKLLAIDLASGEDPLTEYILLTIAEEMEADTMLRGLLSEAPYSIESEDRAIQYIEDNYLSDRLRRYEWMVTLCTPSRDLIVQPDDYVVNCYDYFNDIIERIGKPALGKDQYRYDNEAGLSNYISCSEFPVNYSMDTVRVYVELFSFFIPEEGLGYPELLIDEEIKTFSGLDKYSYARYIDDELVFKYGDYTYRTEFSKYGKHKSGDFFTHNRADHYVYRIDENEFLMISKDQTGFLELLAPFSYLLIFFTLFVLIFILAVNFPFTNPGFELNFRNQLQMYIITLIIISFAIVGIITVRYVINLNTNKNKEALSEKTHSVLIELEHKLSGEEQLTLDMEEYLTSLLIKFSKVFFSDINLYNLEGNLLASSRPQIFQKQLLSTKMNAEAFRILTYDRKLMFIHTETIGDQDYYSAYVPFRNADNNVVAYLNLPYFARQNELQDEISVFLNAFLNLYVLLIAIAIFIAILISRYVTRPLQVIRDKMSRLSLGGSNEKISWSRKDEIGTLIAEYNRMTDELARSAELLAKSERESAWREMAKQVAHEIKNPLTPMKLSVQHLQKAWDEKTENWDERLLRFTQTIIEHIDTLSAIASEFSDFAKMPQKKEEKLDLSLVIKKSLDLFSDIENIAFSYKSSPEPPYYVLADKNQLIRVFNNLIQNAVQAIGHNKEGSIRISLDREGKDYRISIADNGPGIPVEMMDKIFSPSFTTKTSGMGLGLALVKSILIEAGGGISFESSAGEGTTFIITIPVYKDA